MEYISHCVIYPGCAKCTYCVKCQTYGSFSDRSLKHWFLIHLGKTLFMGGWGHWSISLSSTGPKTNGLLWGLPVMGTSCSPWSNPKSTTPLRWWIYNSRCIGSQDAYHLCCTSHLLLFSYDHAPSILPPAPSIFL